MTYTGGGGSDFRTADGHSYILNHRYLATARLSLQHFLWQGILRFIIHPSISVLLPAAPKIADVATGMALWSLDVAQELSEAQIHGYDIDTTQAPPPAWLPANA